MNPFNESSNPFNEDLEDSSQGGIKTVHNTPLSGFGWGVIIYSILFVIIAFFMWVVSKGDDNIWRAAGITTGCLFASNIFRSLYLDYAPSDPGMGLKVFGYFLNSLPLLAGVMFISIGATLKRQEDGTYKMGESEPPFGKTTGPSLYYVAGLFSILLFLGNIFSRFENQHTNKGDPVSLIQKGSFASLAYLERGHMPNFKWKCTKEGDEWHCTAEKN